MFSALFERFLGNSGVKDSDTSSTTNMSTNISTNTLNTSHINIQTDTCDKPRILSIEGNIGSGKSTLLENLKNHYKNDPRVVFLLEPVHEWETICDENGVSMLHKFYDNQDKYSFSFQMMAYISRLAIFKKAFKEHPNALIITERCLHTDKHVFAKMLFDSGKIESVHYQIYLKWFDTFAEDFPVDKIIYVKTDPEICMERIHRRSRNAESTISLEYLQQCHDYHNEMMKLNLSNDTMVLDSNVDIFEQPKQLEHWLEQIEKYIAVTTESVL
jgi:deoxyadenosine/deoxycytidine kinase